MERVALLPEFKQRSGDLCSDYFAVMPAEDIFSQAGGRAPGWSGAEISQNSPDYYFDNHFLGVVNTTLPTRRARSVFGLTFRGECWRFEPNATVVGGQRCDQFADGFDELLDLTIVAIETCFKLCQL